MVPKLTQIWHGERKDRRRKDTDWVLQYWEEESRVGISVVCWVFNLIWCSSRGLYKIGKYIPIYSIIYFKCFHKYSCCFPMPRKSTVDVYVLQTLSDTLEFFTEFQLNWKYIKDEIIYQGRRKRCWQAFLLLFIF